jgi:outer membrane protein assembly factor BamB
VLAVRISDGKELWHHPVNDPESSPAIADDGTVYIGSGFNGNAVVALRIEPDEELRRQNLPRQIWRADAPYPVTGDITLTDDLVIVGAGNGDYVYANPQPAGVVLGLDRKNGRVRFSTPMPDAVLGAIASREGKLICPVRNGEVVALDAKEGKPLWRQRISGDAAVLGGTAFTGKYVYAISRDGYLAVLDASNGQMIEKTFVNEEGKPGELGLCLSSPTVAVGRVFIGSETGGLRCYAGTKAGGAGP